MKISKLELDICNKIYFTASKQGIGKEYSISLQHPICLLYSIIDFFNFSSSAKGKSSKLQLSAQGCCRSQLQSSGWLVFSCRAADRNTRELPVQPDSQWLLCGSYRLRCPFGTSAHSLTGCEPKLRGNVLAPLGQCFLYFYFLMYRFINITLLNACFPKLLLDAFLQFFCFC